MEFLQNYFYGIFELPLPGYRETTKNIPTKFQGGKKVGWWVGWSGI
jgi:hypothetical protein